MSSTQTEKPFWARTWAAVDPDGPAPTMTTSWVAVMGIGAAKGLRRVAKDGPAGYRCPSITAARPRGNARPGVLA